MGSTFDEISEPAPANHEFQFHYRNSRLHNWLTDTFSPYGSDKLLKFGRVKRYFSTFVWKIIFVGFSFWLALAIPTICIWRDLQNLKGKLETGKESDIKVEKGALVAEETVVFDEASTDFFSIFSSTSTTDMPFSEWFSSSTTQNPFAEFEQMVDEKLKESFNTFRAEIQGKWEQCRCPAGMKGERGIDGEPGHPGTPGESIKGEKGSSGELGSPGVPGLQGPPGIRGLPGEKGDRGDSGTIGLPGLTGVKGDRGLSGPNGPAGIPGIPGYKGNKGDRGAAFFG